MSGESGSLPGSDGVGHRGIGGAIASGQVAYLVAPGGGFIPADRTGCGKPRASRVGSWDSDPGLFFRLSMINTQAARLLPISGIKVPPSRLGGQSPAVHGCV
ncbi:MAG: hypothetical protein ACFCU3_00690 [Verrucomicrobiales bacterium]